jgi:hypothetical protein
MAHLWALAFSKFTIQLWIFPEKLIYRKEITTQTLFSSPVKFENNINYLS